MGPFATHAEKIVAGQNEKLKKLKGNFEELVRFSCLLFVLFCF